MNLDDAHPDATLKSTIYMQSCGRDRRDRHWSLDRVGAAGRWRSAFVIGPIRRSGDPGDRQPGVAGAGRPSFRGGALSLDCGAVARGGCAPCLLIGKVPGPVTGF